jgi:hypothetical protein
MGHDIATFGNSEGFHITVREAFGSEGFEITIWMRNSGGGGLPVIRTQEKAVRIAEFLYDSLLPEFEAQWQRQQADIKLMMEEMAKRPKPKPVKIPKNAPIINVLECPSCNDLILPEDVGDERVYECNNCGTTGTGDDGRRCEQCNKFAAKISDTSCPECDGPMDDAETVEAQRATNGSLFKKGDA